MSPYAHCQTCTARGTKTDFEGGTVYAYHCTAEIVVLKDGTKSQIKRCPDFENVSRHKHGVR